MHILELLGGVGIPKPHRYPAAEALHSVEGGVNGWADAIQHILEEINELCDRVGMEFQLHVLELMIERHLAVEFGEGDGLLWASGRCRCAGAGRRPGVGGRWSAVARWGSRVKVYSNRLGLCVKWRVDRGLIGYREFDCGWGLSEAERTS